MTLITVPVSVPRAHDFVAQHHRHSKPLPRWQSLAQDWFAIGAWDGEALRGVAIVARPSGRHVDDGETAEVSRLCTDGTRNACSLLYGACARAARAMGYARIVTYILADGETGASLRASGWLCAVERTDPRGGRRHRDYPWGRDPLGSKQRWQLTWREPVGIRKALHADPGCRATQPGLPFDG